MIYVHVPFCRRKCLYCDFYSVGEKLADWPVYVDAILGEARRRLSAPEAYGLSTPAVANSPGTLYIGGGTPSLMPEAEFARLAEGLVRLGCQPCEFTIEVNPDDVTRDKVNLWHSCGVDRVSMGVQSLCDDELRAVGRRHSARQALDAFDMLRSRFDNISLDLMFGLPYQTVGSLGRTLSGFMDMKPEHVSAYSLMYEERTALTRLRDEGKLTEMPDDMSADMFGLITRTLASGGYGQYEISNYALPGRRSVHNSAYWHGCAYTGLGPGAHSYDGYRTRSFNPSDVRAYIMAGGNVCREEEHLSDDELREEMIMTRLRTREGLGLDEFGRRFGHDALLRLLRDAQKYIDAGMLRLTDSVLVLTHAGVMVSDEVMASLF